MKINGPILELMVAWTVFCILHSYFASLSFKNLISQRAFFLVRYFEYFFVAQSLVLFAIVGFYYLRAGGTQADLEVVYRIPLPFYLGYILSGVSFLMVAFTRISARSVIMAKQKEGINIKPVNPFIKAGLYRATRHPMYFFISLGLIFLPMTLPQLISAAFIIGYFYIGSFFEEQKLVVEFGDEYRAYQKEVSRFLPVRFIVLSLKGSGDQGEKSERPDQGNRLP